MPVVQIEALAQPEAVETARAMRQVRDAVASALGCEPGSVWVTWRTLDAYLCHDQTPAEQPRESHDPILRLIAFAGRSDEAIAGALTGAATVLAGSLGIEPSCVFAVYEEARPGRVFTGGAVRVQDG